MNRLVRIRPSAVVLAVLTIVWLYPVVWTLMNAFRSSADIYRAPWDIAWPPAVGNIAQAWSRAQLGVALANSAYVTALTVGVVLVLSISAAYSLTRLRPPGRALLFTLVLAPLIIPTDVLIVPVFSIFRTLGLINSLSGLALFDVVGTVSFATLILMAFFRTIPGDVIDAARVDGAGRIEVLLRIVVPLSRSGDPRGRDARGRADVERLRGIARADPEAGCLHGAARPEPILDLLRHRPGADLSRGWRSRSSRRWSSSWSSNAASSRV